MVKTAKSATTGEVHNFDCKETQEIFSWVSNTNKSSYLHSQIFTLEKKWGIINKSFNRVPPHPTRGVPFTSSSRFKRWSFFSAFVSASVSVSLKTQINWEKGKKTLHEMQRTL